MSFSTLVPEIHAASFFEMLTPFFVRFCSFCFVFFVFWLFCSLSDAEYISYALAEAQRYQDAYEIIALFRKAYESFNRCGARRMACFCSSRMAKEYYAAEDYSNAKQLFESVAGLYRQEGWATVLWESLGYLRECLRKLGSAKEFVGYSLEMAALPILNDEGPEATESRRDYCPAGPATFSRRVAIQEEVFALVTNAQTPEAEAGGERNLLLTKDLPLCLNIDLTSPWRIVLLASVAFHDQTVKPNSPTLITVSLLSQLARPVEIDLLEVQFNQPTCNFRIVDSQKDISTAAFILDDQDVRLETALLKLLPNKWLRLTYEIKSGKPSALFYCFSISTFMSPICLIFMMGNLLKEKKKKKLSSHSAIGV